MSECAQSHFKCGANPDAEVSDRSPKSLTDNVLRRFVRRMASPHRDGNVSEWTRHADRFRVRLDTLGQLAACRIRCLAAYSAVTRVRLPWLTSARGPVAA